MEKQNEKFNETRIATQEAEREPHALQQTTQCRTDKEKKEERKNERNSGKEGRNFLYNGETIWIEGIFDAVKISAYKSPLISKDKNSKVELYKETNLSQDMIIKNINTNLNELNGQAPLSCQYIGGTRPYYVPSTVDAIRLDYLEFTKSVDCPEKYCISNEINIADKTVLKSEIFSVMAPFQIVEKLQGNYLTIHLIPAKTLSHEAHSKSIVTINGNRMKFKNNSYRLKIQRIADWADPIYVSVDFEQIHYSRELFISLPTEFIYSISLKIIDRKHFIRLVLGRIIAEKYQIDILNPTIGPAADYKTENLVNVNPNDHTPVNSLKTTDVSLYDLKIRSPSAQIIIDMPESVTEILLEVIKKPENNKTYLFSAKVNNYPIEFCVTI
jgi:hypothetical protein